MRASFFTVGDETVTTETARSMEWPTVVGSQPCFVVFSDDWGEHPSSCQHIFRRVSEHYRVIWVNTIGMRSPTLTFSDFRKALTKLGKMFFGKQTDSRSHKQWSVKVLSPPMLPFGRYRWVRWLNRKSVARSLRRATSGNDGGKQIVVSTVPNACDYVDVIPQSQIVYYCVDDFSEWPGLDKALILGMEDLLVQKSTLILATSQNLRDRLARSGKPTEMLSHGVDVELFSQNFAKDHMLLGSINRPRVGFFGLFDERFDQPLLAEVASRLPEVSFVIAGQVVCDTRVLDGKANARFVGPVVYEELPALIRGLDVLIIPYNVNELSNSLSPLKLKEYLATGKPIISTPIAAAEDFLDCIAVCDGADQWVEAIGSKLSGEGPAAARRRLERVAGDSWESKAIRLVQASFLGNAGPETAAADTIRDTASSGR